jgi:Fe-S-cluster containining protein
MPMKMPVHMETEVRQLFATMDAAYGLAAGKAGFDCKGCQDNCCRTLFFHHTLLELLYLRSGLAAWPVERLERIALKAREADREMASQMQRGQAVRVMCPLNEEGRCLLYAHRPMICRLHGIPHRLQRLDGQVLTGPGCEAYEARCGQNSGHSLERTPLYTAMAALERQLREQLGFERKIKLTVAQMMMTEP